VRGDGRRERELTEHARLRGRGRFFASERAFLSRVANLCRLAVVDLCSAARAWRRWGRRRSYGPSSPIATRRAGRGRPWSAPFSCGSAATRLPPTRLQEEEALKREAGAGRERRNESGTGEGESSEVQDEGRREQGDGNLWQRLTARACDETKFPANQPFQAKAQGTPSGTVRVLTWHCLRTACRTVLGLF
jgi:hypothetical protein